MSGSELDLGKAANGATDCPVHEFPSGAGGNAMQDRGDARIPRTGGTKRSLLRSLVVLLAITEIATVAYVWYALYIDDTTSWVVLIFPEADDLRQALSLPLGIGGGLALAFGMADRWLPVALALAVAAPVVSALWLFG